MFKHALVGIDFSQAWPRLQQRIGFLQQWGLEAVTLVYVLSSRYPAVPEESHRPHYEQKLKEQSEELSSTGLSVDWEIRTGEPGQELVKAATEQQADLLLVGSLGHSRVWEFFLGSTALDIARLTEMPLWLEPVLESPMTQVGTVLLATDGSDAVAAAETLFTELAPRANRALAVTVLDDSGDSDSVREQAHAHLESLSTDQVSMETDIPSGDPRRELLQYVQREGVELMIMGQRGRNPLRQLLLGSVAEAACRGLDIPVLLVPGARS